MELKDELAKYYEHCKFIFDYYGEENQKKQLIQELAELIMAVTKEDNDNFIEELADVLIMIDQFLISYPDIDDSVRGVQFLKIERQLDRIGEELEK